MPPSLSARKNLTINGGFRDRPVGEFAIGNVRPIAAVNDPRTIQLALRLEYQEN